MIQSFYHREHLLKSINESHICLIPKGEVQDFFADFRLISLYNVLYKIITKALTSRMKPLLEDLIFPNQCAFIKGRDIFDNLIITSEIYQFMRTSKSKKSFWAAVKIDFKKAFNCLRWDFIRQVLFAMEFPSKWINLVMECITTLSYKVLVNGEQSEQFFPARGLRQGDPISPYLFILCVNVLSFMLFSAQIQNTFQGVKISRHALPITYLFYADDLMIFFKASLNLCQVKFL